MCSSYYSASSFNAVFYSFNIIFPTNLIHCYNLRTKRANSHIYSREFITTIQNICPAANIITWNSVYTCRYFTSFVN